MDIILKTASVDELNEMYATLSKEITDMMRVGCPILFLKHKQDRGIVSVNYTITRGSCCCFLLYNFGKQVKDIRNRDSSDGNTENEELSIQRIISHDGVIREIFSNNPGILIVTKIMGGTIPVNRKREASHVSIQRMTDIDPNFCEYYNSGVFDNKKIRELAVVSKELAKRQPLNVVSAVHEIATRKKLHVDWIFVKKDDNTTLTSICTCNIVSSNDIILFTSTIEIISDQHHGLKKELKCDVAALMLQNKAFVNF